MGKGVGGLIAFALAAGMFAATAHAAFPGENGRIAFSQDEGCFHESANILYAGPAGAMPNPGFTFQVRQQPAWSPDGMRLAYYEDGGITVSKLDGTERQAIASPGFDIEPAWSPEGGKIAFSREESQIWSMNADGSGQVQLTGGAWKDSEPAWSPDGTTIAFTSTRDGDAEIFVMGADGSGETQITTNGVSDRDPNWSPDGTQIAFERSAEIWRMNADGRGAVQLTSNSIADEMPAWSPNGSTIVFTRGKFTGTDAQELWTIDTSGGSLAQVTAQGDSCDDDPDWQPIPVNAYPRPRGASPLYLSLVPAYRNCAAPNTSHGGPLAFGSCAPPSPSPSSVTVGQRSIASAILSTKSGNPATAADEADVRLRVSAGDVRAVGSLGDYDSAVEAHPTFRITDRDNLPHPGGPGPGTLEVGLRFSVPCTATADTSVGSTCALATTVDTLVPNAVKEGRRAVWELASFDLNDGDEGVFLRPGVFVP
jgi:hypothetical protein